MSELSGQPVHVLIAGGGIAGIEAALALRAFAGAAADVTVVDPGRRFSIPATATGRAFGVAGGVDLRLADVVDRAGARLLHGRLAAVDPVRHAVVLAGGAVLAYDALIVAVGATPVAAVPGALTFAGTRDVEAVRGLIDDVSRRAARGAGVDLAIVVPPGCAWPLAAYELALMMHEHLVQEGADETARICVVTSEERPLGLFGDEASATVERMLARAGIAVRIGLQVRSWSAGRLELGDGTTLWADRAIALPVHRGPFIEGLPADPDGFIPTGADGRVGGLRDVWAVGDGTTYPLKQGGVACQQADVAATAIAEGLGARVEAPPEAVVLRGWMWDGRRGRALPSGAPRDDPGRGDPAPVWPVAKIGGRFLAPFLHSMVTQAVPIGAIGVPG